MEKESLLVCVTRGDSAQHVIRRRDEKMAMIMSGNTNAPGTTLLQHLNGGGGMWQLGRYQQQQKELTTVAAETPGRRTAATAPVKRTIAVETFMVVEY